MIWQNIQFENREYTCWLMISGFLYINRIIWVYNRDIYFIIRFLKTKYNNRYHKEISGMKKYITMKEGLIWSNIPITQNWPWNAISYCYIKFKMISRHLFGNSYANNTLRFGIVYLPHLYQNEKLSSYVYSECILKPLFIGNKKLRMHVTCSKLPRKQTSFNTNWFNVCMFYLNVDCAVIYSQ